MTIDMNRTQSTSEPYIFMLVRECLFCDRDPCEVEEPFKGSIVNVLIALAGVVLLIYSVTFGLLSRVVF
jgi:hypothetical protein